MTPNLIFNETSVAQSRKSENMEEKVEGKWCTTESHIGSHAITDNMKSAVALVTFDVIWPSLVSAPGAGLIGGKPRGLARQPVRISCEPRLA